MPVQLPHRSGQGGTREGATQKRRERERVREKKKSGHLQYMKKQADCPDSSDKEEERESCFANQGKVWGRESG